MTHRMKCSRPGEVSVASCIMGHYMQDIAMIMCCVFNIPLVSITDLLPHEDGDRLNDVKFLVQQLYTTLHIEGHQLNKERELIGRLEDLNSQLRPLEKVPALISG